MNINVQFALLLHASFPKKVKNQKKLCQHIVIHAFRNTDPSFSIYQRRFL